MTLIAVHAACSDSAGPRIGDEQGFMDVVIGAQHSCALSRRGDAYCWGSDESQQLGNTERGNSVIPVRAETNAGLVSISAGNEHTCALDSSGNLYCWGANNYGQLGNATTVTLPRPVVLVTTLRFVQVTAGARHTCALTASGVAYCWGAGGQGQLGTGSFRSVSTPVEVAGTVRFAMVAAGGTHTCGLALDGSAYCWGDNSSGQLGNGTVDNVAGPTVVSGSLRFQRIAAGPSHSCGVAEDGVAYCWGSSEFGELGGRVTLPGGPAALVPTPVFGSGRYIAISAGSGFTCAIDTNNRAECWGRGLEGQLGNGQIRNWSTPQSVSDGQINAAPLLFAGISASGRTHACGLTTSSAVYCWGRGDVGQLGNAALSFSPLAVRIQTQ